jgi:hypothetical protein
MDLEGSGLGIIEVISRNLPGEILKNTKIFYEDSHVPT